MKTFIRHMKTYMVRGLLAIIPLVLSILVIQILYINIDRRVVGLLDRTIGFSFPGLGIILSLVALYLLGFIASNIVGKKIFGLPGWSIEEAIRAVVSGGIIGPNEIK